MIEIIFSLAVLSSISGGSNIETHVMRVTAYCACQRCCGPLAAGITASGRHIKKGDKLVAADKQYPFNTLMTIPGYNKGKPVKVLDRGGAIKGNKLDVYFDSHREALQWGVKTLKVKIWRKR